MRDMERRLTAILAADVVGYSRLMEQDEAGTFERLRQRRMKLVEPLVTSYRGRVFKRMGDGLLAEFGSAVDAVEAAVALQKATMEADRDSSDDRRIDWRIGVHVGDVIVDGEDRQGDAVNVAARLQELADRGGVCVSRSVVDHVRNKVALGFELRGEERLKNIAEPIAVFTTRFDGAPAKQAPSLPDKPSIAVLPFENLSGDPAQEYFADGMVEEITMALSRMRWLFVIARNSSFTYKGRAVDVKQVGRELGVRYVLEGSVRRAGSRVRIAGQLIDATTGAHLWAHRFEGAVDDIFELQDQVTASVVGSIAPRLEQAEIERALRKPTENLDAYDYFLRGMAAFHRWTRAGNAEALSNFHRAIALDPNFASAYGMAARCYPQRKAAGWVVDGAREVAEAERLARRAAELAGSDALALGTAGFALGYAAGELETGAALIERALQINPNLAWVWVFGGWSKLWLGEPEDALEHIDRAIRLSPQDPQLFQMQTVGAYAHLFLDRFSEAMLWAERALLERSNHVSATRVLAASCAMAGRQEQASKAMARLRDLDPALRLSNIKDLFPLRRRQDIDRLTEGLRKAGLPE
jgi:TolB-like protein/Flp pilus assembly protein TadD